MIAWAAALALLAGQQAEPAPPPATLAWLPALAGAQFDVPAREIGRTFHIYVRLPSDYATTGPAHRYPVVYVLDGDSLWPMLAANHLFIHYDDRLPEAIVVGIAYGGFGPEVNKRGIDFTGPGSGVAPEAAGAPAFQRFLKTELLPLIEGRYRADPERRILIGQSRGGSFVLYSAFTDPDLFWGRIASNPALDPGRERFFAAPARATRPGLTLIYASGSNDRPALRADALAWFDAWRDRRDAPWAIHAVTIDGGTHSADAARAYREGMRRLFPRDPVAK